MDTVVGCILGSAKCIATSKTVNANCKVSVGYSRISYTRSLLPRVHTSMDMTIVRPEIRWYGCSSEDRPHINDLTGSESGAATVTRGSPPKAPV